MALSSSFQSQGAIPKAISSVKNYLSPSNTQGFFGSPTSSVSKPTTTPSLGTNPGVINPPTAPVKSTVDRTGTTTNYSTKPNPSVLEQQKALNKLGAGLVEDGITGPKTREAIAKFGNTTTPTTNPTTAPKVETPPPAPLTVAGQTPGLLKTGQQTGNEAETQKKVEEAGAITQWENDVRNGMAVEEANKRLTDFRTAVAKKYADIESQAIPLEFQQGRAGALARQFASQESALQQGVANALTNQGQQFGAAQAQASRGASTAGQAFTGAQTQAQRATGTYGTALGAIAPTFPSYGSQIVQPGLLGTASGVTGANLQADVANVVQRLQSGTMSYNDALAALSGYGQGGVSALQQSLPPNFNIAQSNTLAGQQGSVGVNYQLAETALSNVENLIKELGATQKTNIPAVNKAANWISTQFGLGSEQTRAVTGAVQSLRNAYASLLASSRGGTPTDYSGQAQAEIPNEPTPNDIAAIRKNFETLGQARKDILSNPGQAGGTSEGQTSAGGFNFKLVNGKWVPA